MPTDVMSVAEVQGEREIVVMRVFLAKKGVMA
jgi:hypothetical protein